MPPLTTRQKMFMVNVKDAVMACDVNARRMKNEFMKAHGIHRDIYRFMKGLTPGQGSLRRAYFQKVSRYSIQGVGGAREFSIYNKKAHIIKKYLENGTRSHWVQPRRAKAMRWTGLSGLMSSRMVGGINKPVTGRFFSKGHDIRGTKAHKIIALSYAALKRRLRRAYPSMSFREL